MRLFNSIFILIFCIFYRPYSLYAQQFISIEEAISQAVYHNHEVRMARNSVRVGEINNTWANAGLVPLVNATANKTFGLSNLDQKLNNGNITQKKGSTTQNLNAGVNVNWRVFDGFKMFATKKKLEELELAGRYQFQKQVNETVFDVFASYYRIVMLKEQVEATAELIDLYEQRLQLAQMKFEIGTGAKFEVLEAEVDRNGQKSNLINLQNQLLREKVSLSQIMGMRADTLFEVADTILLSGIRPLEESKMLMEKQNPDVLLAASDLNILLQEKREINSARLPAVTLNGNYNFVRSRNSAGFTLYNQSYGPSGSIGLTIPIFNAGQVKRQLQVAEIGIENRRVATDKLKNDLEAALYDQAIRYNENLKVIDLERENLQKAGSNILIAMERYKLLNITAVELRQIQISYNDVKNRLFNGLYEAKMAEAANGLLTGSLDFL